MRVTFSLIGIICLSVFSTFLFYENYHIKIELREIESRTLLMNETILTLQEKVKIANNRIIELNDTLSSALRSMNRLKEDTTLLMEEVKELRNSTAELKRNLNELSIALSQFNSNVIELRNMIENISVAVNSVYEYLNKVDSDIAVTINWLKNMTNELSVIADILYGRAHMSPLVLIKEPTVEIRELVSRSVGNEPILDALSKLSEVVYEKVRYTRDPNIAPVLIEHSEITLKYMRILLPRYVSQIVSTRDVLRTPTETLVLHKGDCDDYSILYLSAADYYLDVNMKKHAVVQVIYVGRDLRGTYYGHAIVIGVVSNESTQLWFLADPTWRGYFTYASGPKSEGFDLMLECILTYMKDNEITYFAPRKALTYNCIDYITSLWELYQTIVSILNKNSV